MINKIELVKPSTKYEASFLEAVKEYDNWQGFKTLGVEACQGITHDNLPNYIKMCEDCALGLNLQEGFVPETYLWLIIDDNYAGSVNIRHNIDTEILSTWGGHIAYQIRPSYIGKGFAAPMLAKAIEYAANTLNLEKVMISCDEDNIASKKTIQKVIPIFGGKQINNFVFDDEDKKACNIFWINTPLYYNRYISDEINITLKQKEKFIEEARSLRRNLLLRNEQK